VNQRLGAGCRDDRRGSRTPYRRVAGRAGPVRARAFGRPRPDLRWQVGSRIGTDEPVERSIQGGVPPESPPDRAQSPPCATGSDVRGLREGTSAMFADLGLIAVATKRSSDNPDALSSRRPSRDLDRPRLIAWCERRGIRRRSRRGAAWARRCIILRCCYRLPVGPRHTSVVDHLSAVHLPVACGVLATACWRSAPRSHVATWP